MILAVLTIAALAVLVSITAKKHRVKSTLPLVVTLAIYLGFSLIFQFVLGTKVKDESELVFTVILGIIINLAVAGGLFLGARYWIVNNAGGAGAAEEEKKEAAITGGTVRVSKPLFLGLIGGPFIIAVILIIYRYVAFGFAKELPYDEAMSTQGIMLMSKLISLVGGITIYVLIYRMWQAIQDGHARTSPGRGVGYMFIPFYNFYWAFQAIWGWAKDFNAYIERHKVETEKVPEELFVMFPAVLLVTLVGSYVHGLIHLLGSVAYCGILVLMVFRTCDAINSLPALEKKEPAGPAAAPPSVTKDDDESGSKEDENVESNDDSGK